VSLISRVSSIAVVLAVLGNLAFVATTTAQPKNPPDFSFTKGKDSPGTVTFSHEKHMAAGNKCTSCHTKIFKMKKGTSGDLTMAKMKAGEQCGACHDGKKQMGGKVVFTTDDKANCEKCHKK
jgi:c(7)-type cytochrome triheme protein